MRVAHRCLLPFVFALAGVGFAAGAPARSFDLPADVIEKSLKRFAAQSGLQVLFPTDAVAGVRSRPVQGEMTSRQALDQMLVGTGFAAVQDPKSGALTVKKLPAEPPASAPSSPYKSADEK
jgi:iron complex outermembrane receptor protein